MAGTNSAVESLRVVQRAVGRVPGDGIELAFGFWPGRGAPVVALPGLTANHLGFGGIAERLAGRRSLLAFDLRGRGDADKPAGPFGMEQHARDVATAMRSFGLGPSVIMGVSMGTQVALALASEAPELVSGLLLVDGGAPPPFPPGIDITEMMEAFLQPVMERLRRTFPSREAYFEFLRSEPSFADNWNPWVEAYFDNDLGGEPPELRSKVSEAAIRADTIDSARVDAIEARLRALKAPALLVRAEFGLLVGQPPVFSEETLQTLKGFVPDLEDHFVPGSTHYTQSLCDPGVSIIADLTVDFASRCER